MHVMSHQMEVTVFTPLVASHVQLERRFNTKNPLKWKLLCDRLYQKIQLEISYLFTNYQKLCIPSVRPHVTSTTSECGLSSITGLK